MDQMKENYLTHMNLVLTHFCPNGRLYGSCSQRLIYIYIYNYIYTLIYKYIKYLDLNWILKLYCQWMNNPLYFHRCGYQHWGSFYWDTCHRDSQWCIYRALQYFTSLTRYFVSYTFIYIYIYIYLYTKI